MHKYDSTAIGQDRAALASEPSATTVAYRPCSDRDKLRTVTFLLPSVYDYAGSCRAINPILP